MIYRIYKGMITKSKEVDNGIFYSNNKSSTKLISPKNPSLFISDFFIFPLERLI